MRALLVIGLLQCCLICRGIAQTSCDEGYYNSDGQCLRCDESCKTCEGPDTCTSCIYHKYLDGTTGLCELCEYGEFYDETLEVCKSCDGKCKGKCSYQDFCYDCPEGQFYDLENLICVDACQEDQMAISSDQFGDVSICRGYDFYVNPMSEEIVQLGTNAYPYKSISFPLIEILNHFTNSYVSVNIYVMERTTNHIILNQNRIQNMTSVNIEAYSDYDPENPERADLIVVDKGKDGSRTFVSEVTNGAYTIFHIMKTFSLNDINFDAMEDIEATQMRDLQAAFVVNRASFYINQIDVITEYSTLQIYSDFITSIFNQGHETKMTNMHIQVQGGVYQNLLVGSDVKLINMTIDSYNMKYGIVYVTECNFPEAVGENEIYIDNLYVYNSVERISLLENDFISNMGNANMTIINSRMEVYGDLSTAYSAISLRTNPLCLPQDDYLQTITIDNTLFSLYNNEYSIKFINIVTDIEVGSLRTYVANINNNRFTNIEKSYYPLFTLSGVGSDTYNFINNTFSNVTFVDGLMEMQRIGYVNIYNMTYMDSVNEGRYMFNFIDPIELNLEQITISNVQSFEDNAWIIASLNMGDVNINTLDLEDVQINTLPAFSLQGQTNKLTVVDCAFNGVIVGKDVSIFEIGELATFQFDNLNFTEVYGYSTESVNNYMIDIQSIGLASDERSYFRNSFVSQCNIGCFQIGSFTDSLAPSKQFDIENIQFSDCFFEVEANMVRIGEIMSQEDFNISMRDLSFKNLSFKNRGALIQFQQLLTSQMIVEDMVMEDIIGGSISINPFDESNDVLKTRVIFKNLYANRINADFSSLIKVTGGADLEINDSTFYNVFCLEEGSVLYAGASETNTLITNTVFENNTSLIGGAIYVKSRSYVKCENCTFYRNFAIEGGAIATEEDGYFEFSNSIITRNLAISGSVSNIYNSGQLSTINHCDVYDNRAIGKEELMEEITVECRELCFFDRVYNDYLITKDNLLNPIASVYCFGSVIGQFSIINDTKIHDQMRVIDAISSYIVLEDSYFYDVVMIEPSIKLRISTLELTNTIFENIDVDGEARLSLITGISDSYLVLRGLIYRNSQAPLISFLRCEADVEGLVIENVTSTSSIMTVDTSTFFSVSHINMNNVISYNEDLITINDSYVVKMDNITITDIKQLILLVKNSRIGMISNMNLNGCSQGIKAIEGSDLHILTSKFNNMGSVDELKGSAMYIFNSNLTLDQVSFENNTSINAGSIDFECDKDVKCGYLLNSCNFTNSTASESGGAIRYNLYRPIFEDVLYVNNSAYYGPNIASYPINIRFKDATVDEMSFENVASGMPFVQPLELVVEDHDKQIMRTNNYDLIVIDNTVPNTSISGVTQKVVTEGVAVFEGIEFRAKPGSRDVGFSVLSKAIDPEIMALQYGATQVQEEIKVSFRYCEPGERERDNICETCYAGTYSNAHNATECKDCMENAVCLGGKMIEVDNRYWRYSHESNEVIKCLGREACVGGYDENAEHPVKCERGYQGVLCAFCKDEDGVRYEKTSEFVCSQCPEPVGNAIQIIALSLIVMAFLGVLVAFIVRKTGDDQKSVLMKIITNYMQVLVAIYAFNIDFPDVMAELFSATSSVGSPTEAFLSFDCFISSNHLTSFTDGSVSYFKVFLVAITPIFLIAGAAVIWVLLKLLRPDYFKNTMRNIFISGIVILFVLHPTLTKYGMSVFECILVDTDKSRSRIQLEEDCFSPRHIKWCMVLGLPILIVWGFGIPIVTLIVLIKNRTRLDTIKFKKYFIMIYQGYRTKVYYWELVNTARKMFLLMINSFLLTYSLFYRGLISVIMLVVVLRLHVWLQPYKIEENNSLSELEIMTEMFTIFAGMLFVTEENYVGKLNAIIFIAIIILNIRFVLFWTYYMLCEFRHKYKAVAKVAEFLTYILFTPDVYLEKMKSKTSMTKQTMSVSKSKSSMSKKNSLIMKKSGFKTIEFNDSVPKKYKKKVVNPKKGGKSRPNKLPKMEDKEFKKESKLNKHLKIDIEGISDRYKEEVKSKKSNKVVAAKSIIKRRPKDNKTDMDVSDVTKINVSQWNTGSNKEAKNKALNDESLDKSDQKDVHQLPAPKIYTKKSDRGLKRKNLKKENSSKDDVMTQDKFNQVIGEESNIENEDEKEKRVEVFKISKKALQKEISNDLNPLENINNDNKSQSRMNLGSNDAH